MMRTTKTFHRWVMLTVLPGAVFFSCKGKKDLLRLAPVHTGSSWGYQIFRNNRPVIYQAEIPAIAGHHPFSSKEEAMRVGRLVMKKLQHGESPAVSPRELDSMGIRPN
ncbi:DUF4907 domain-containing protein [Chitinophaga lutea]|nr:DUF4907 domain-containing protein [Chitinophaga lutea]